MANTTASPNMGMPVPTVSQDPGPDWATNVDACLSIVDSHTHTAGQGVPITPQAININSDLTFAGNNGTNFRSVRFSPQSGTITGPSDLGALYENDVDLYYVDGAGNQVRITQGGSVTGSSGTITGLPSGTASASFAGSTFTFQSATNTPATINAGTYILGQTVAGGKNVTIAANGAQAANYNLTLPIALPSVQAATVSDNSGNLSFLTLQSSTYTPTLSSPIGGSGFAVFGPFMVMQIGNMVTVTGGITYTPTAGITTTSISLPVARTAGNFDQLWEAQGVVGSSQSGKGIAGTAVAVVGSQLVSAGVSSSSGNTSGSFTVNFTYSLVNF